MKPLRWLKEKLLRKTEEEITEEDAEASGWRPNRAYRRYWARQQRKHGAGYTRAMRKGRGGDHA